MCILTMPIMCLSLCVCVCRTRCLLWFDGKRKSHIKSVGIMWVLNVVAIAFGSQLIRVAGLCVGLVDFNDLTGIVTPFGHPKIIERNRVRIYGEWPTLKFTFFFFFFAFKPENGVKNPLAIKMARFHSVLMPCITHVTHICDICYWFGHTKSFKMQIEIISVCVCVCCMVWLADDNI